MIAIDTNILIYAHRPEFPFHDQARECLHQLAGSGKRYGIPIHCVMEFSGVVSQGRLWKQASSPQQIQLQIETWLEPPGSSLLEEDVGMLTHFWALMDHGKVSGGAVHDARIAACCRRHGVSVLWSADRDFSRYPELKVLNPLLA